jgi:hypothetical protein
VSKKKEKEEKEEKERLSPVTWRCSFISVFISSGRHVCCGRRCSGEQARHARTTHPSRAAVTPHAAGSDRTFLCASQAFSPVSLRTSVVSRFAAPM